MFKLMAGMYVGGATLISAIFGIHRSGPPALPSDMPQQGQEQGMMHDGMGTTTPDFRPGMMHGGDATSTGRGTDDPMHPAGWNAMGSTTPGARGRGDDRGTTTSPMNPGMNRGTMPTASTTRPTAPAPRPIFGKVLGISGMTISLEARVPAVTASDTPESAGQDGSRDGMMMPAPAAAATVSVDATNAAILKGFASTTASFSDIAVGGLISVEGELASGMISAKVIRVGISASSTRRLMRQRRGGSAPKGNPPQPQAAGLQPLVISGSRQ